MEQAEVCDRDRLMGQRCAPFAATNRETRSDVANRSLNEPASPDPVRKYWLPWTSARPDQRVRAAAPVPPQHAIPRSPTYGSYGPDKRKGEEEQLTITVTPHGHPADSADCLNAAVAAGRPLKTCEGR